MTARTSKSWTSWASGPATNGEVQGTYADPSTEHSKVASAWSEVNSNVAVYPALRVAGCAVRVVVGSPIAVQVWLAGVGSVLGGSARSTARTSRVCSPDASPISSWAASHAVHSPPSRRHS